MQVLLQAGAAKDATTCDGRTPVHVAASRGDMAILEELPRGMRRTKAASAPAWKVMNYKICGLSRWNLQIGTMPASSSSIHNKICVQVGWTPLHCAAQYADLACLDALLTAGAIKDVQDNCGWTPLHWAAHCGDLECLVALLNAGAATDVRENSGSTPLHWVASHGQTECLVALLNAGAAEARRPSKSPQSLAT
ncbi:ANK2 [Symbiodinium sp. CCMP2592]|nr:ANK2 [Symbiodinium sp. CCMP2592]